MTNDIYLSLNKILRRIYGSPISDADKLFERKEKRGASPIEFRQDSRHLRERYKETSKK